MKRRSDFLVKGKYWKTGRFPYTDDDLPSKAEIREETEKTAFITLLNTMAERQQKLQQQQQQPHAQPRITGGEIGTARGDMLLYQVWFKVKGLLKSAHKNPDDSIDKEAHKKALDDNN